MVEKTFIYISHRFSVMIRKKLISGSSNNMKPLERMIITGGEKRNYREFITTKLKRNSWIRENMIPVNFHIQNGVLE